MTIPDPKFKEQDIVYHITPESKAGKIITMIYSFQVKKYRYLVTTNFGDNFWCDEEELTDEKVFF